MQCSRSRMGGGEGGQNGNGYKNANTSAVAVESLEVPPLLPQAGTKRSRSRPPTRCVG